MSRLIKDIERLRIELDSLIKQVDYNDQFSAWSHLVNAKDSMGMAQLDLAQLELEKE